MRNHFLLQYLCTAAILSFSLNGFAEGETAAAVETLMGEAGVVGSIPEVVPFKSSTVVQNEKLQGIVSSQIIPTLSVLNAAGMSSAALLYEIQVSIETLMKTKIACSDSADTAEQLCIEGKSPQAIIAKGIVNAAGPILASINSAQKSCSTTASTTNLAQQAMSLAKGACVGAKLICDTTCSKADAELKVISSKLTIFQTKAMAEYKLRLGASIDPLDRVILEPVPPALVSLKATVEPVLVAESAPAPTGTTTSLVVRCQGYSKDVALFATNIFGLLAANKSANECKDKLASTGGNPSAQEYCAIATNTSSTFCKCQKDQTAEGCPGHLAVTPTTSKETKDGKGNNIKSDGKGNQFAGGFDPVKPGPVDLGGLKSDGTTRTAGDDKKADAGGGGFGSAGTSGGGSSGGGSGAGKGSDAKDAVAGEDRKKTGLGSFFGLGGGSSSGSGSGKSGNGSLGQKDMDAIQRQIASEKLRAEVSGASGKSNWEKVSERYLRNKSTLLVGQ